MVEFEEAEGSVYHFTANLVFDPLSGEIREGLQTRSRLTPLEGRALEILVRHPDKVVDNEALVRHLYPGESDYEGDLLHPTRHPSVISRLRDKLEAVSPDLATQLETFPKRGYRWTVDISAPESSAT